MQSPRCTSTQNDQPEVRRDDLLGPLAVGVLRTVFTDVLRLILSPAGALD